MRNPEVVEYLWCCVLIPISMSVGLMITVTNIQSRYYCNVITGLKVTCLYFQFLHPIIFNNKVEREKEDYVLKLEKEFEFCKTKLQSTLLNPSENDIRKEMKNCRYTQSLTGGTYVNYY